MSVHHRSKIGTTRTITTDRRARREDRAARNRLRDNAASSDLRCALRDARPLLAVHRPISGDVRATGGIDVDASTVSGRVRNR